MKNRKAIIITVLAVLCLTIPLFAIALSGNPPSAGEYDPWLDWNDDKKIDMKDVSRVARAFGTNGTSVSKASIEYESDWINITDKCGQNIIITHNLNSTDLIVDIQGKITLDSGPHQKHYGLTSCTTGWCQNYNAADFDFVYSMVQTGDGGYALAGYTSSPSSFSDAWLIKTDAFGRVQWNRTYGGPYNDAFCSLVQSSDGGYALAGWSDVNDYDFWLVKTDANGNMQWNRTYGGVGIETAYCLIKTNDFGYALAGYTNSPGANGFDFWLVKTDSLGNMQWSRTYGSSHDEFGTSLVQSDDGDYAIVGYDVVDYTVHDVYLVKTDSFGNMQWNKTYGGTGSDSGYCLIRTDDGGYAIAGGTSSFGYENDGFWLVKTDSGGNILWNRTYGGRGVAYSVVQTRDAGYVLAGCTTQLGTDDFWLVKTDKDGNIQWNRTYGGTGTDEAVCVVPTSEGGYALAGWTTSLGTGRDAWLVRTEAEEGLSWTDSTANTLTLHRGATDPYWNFVRVRLWKPR